MAAERKKADLSNAIILDKLSNIYLYLYMLFTTYVLAAIYFRFERHFLCILISIKHRKE